MSMRSSVSAWKGNSANFVLMAFREVRRMETSSAYYLLPIVHVPEDPLAFLMEGARRDNPRHVSPSAPDALPPAARGFRIRFGSRNVGEGYLKAAPQCPQPVHPLYVDAQGVLGEFHFGHSRPPL